MLNTGTKNWIGNATALALALSTAACVEDMSDEAPLLEEHQQAVAGTLLTPFYQTQTTNSTACTFRACRKDLASAADQTCFLAGVKGSLSEAQSLYPSGVRVLMSQGRWVLEMDNPYGSGIGARAVCITNTANRIVSHSWHSSDPVASIGAGTTGKRRCFLAGVRNYNDTAFSTFDTNVYIRRNTDGTTTVGGTFPAGSSVRVYTTCVDVDVNRGDWEYGNGISTAFTGQLAVNDGGVACGLTGIGGHIETMSQGADITYPSPNWAWWIGAYGGARAHCFK